MSKKNIPERVFARSKDGTYAHVPERTGEEHEKYQKMLKEAFAEMKQIKEKYGNLAELEEVIDAIDMVMAGYDA